MGHNLHSTHEQTKETADCEKLVESLGVDGGNLQEAKDDHVDNLQDL